jgi:PIN domain nuclease of toxin-antitoxin system
MAARQRIAEPVNDVWVSVVSLWEIAVKLRVGKIRAELTDIIEILVPPGFRLLELRPPHVLALGELPVFSEHRDPFDHLLIEQAISEEFSFMSDDVNVGRYAVRRVGCSR